MEFQHPYFTEEEKAEYLADTLEMLKKGYSRRKIEEELAVGKHYIKKMEKVLIDHGKITETEIKQSREEFLKKEKIELFGKREKQLDTNSNEFQTIADEMIKMLNQGEKLYNIRKKLKITSEEYKMFGKAIKKGVSKEQRKQRIELRKLRELQYVAEQINRGYNLTEIQKQNPELLYSEVEDYAKIAKEIGALKVKEAVENYKKKVIENGIRDGLTLSEMQNKTISMSSTVRLMKKIFEEGNISKEEYRKNVKKNHDKMKQLQIQQVKEYMQKGYKFCEISKMMYINLDKISDIKKHCVSNGEWYSKEQITQFREERKKRQKQEESIDRARKKVKYEREIEKTRNYFSRKKGYLVRLEKGIKIGCEPQKEDLDLALSLILETPRLANKENIKFIIMKNLQWNGIDETQSVVSRLKEGLKQTPYEKRLEKYEKILKNNLKHVKKEEKTEFDISPILEQLGMNADQTDKRQERFDSEDFILE